MIHDQVLNEATNLCHDIISTALNYLVNGHFWYKKPAVFTSPDLTALIIRYEKDRKPHHRFAVRDNSFKRSKAEAGRRLTS